MYTLTDLELAREEAARIEARWSNYSGNNPNKYLAEMRSASAKVEVIETQLKALGVLEMSQEELLQAELNRLFPSANGKDIVNYLGSRFQLTYLPASLGRRGTVKSWAKLWRLID